MSASFSDDDFDWSDFDHVLKSTVTKDTYQGVTANLVDYASLLSDTKFQKIADKLDQFNPDQLQGSDKLAFYINAYNYYAIKIVLDNWPVEGIKDIGSLLRPVWKKTVGKIGGKNVTLNQIEHEILRPLGEPRIHFAIVCSSMSCPDLRTEAYVADRLNEQLEQQVRLFLSNTTKGALIKGDQLYLSEIFDWFEEDFEPKGVYSFIGTYRKELQNFEAFKTLEYNWTLNKKQAK